MWVTSSGDGIVRSITMWVTLSGDGIVRSITMWVTLSGTWYCQVHHYVGDVVWYMVLSVPSLCG